MLDEPEDDVLELGEAPEDDAADTDVNDTIDAADGEEAGDEAVGLPTFADDGEEEAGDTDLVKHLRAELRKAQSDKKALEQTSKPQPIVVGEKPTLWDDDIAGDEDKYDAAILAWDGRKRQAEAQANTVSDDQRKQNEIWQARTADFAQKRTAYPPALMNDCETALASTLSEPQRIAIIRYAKNPAALTVALGRSPAKLDALAKVEDIGEFIAATALLERDVKMPTRKPSAQPDEPVRGSASMTASTDAELARLEKEADRTGDRSKIAAYRREKRIAAAKR